MRNVECKFELRDLPVAQRQCAVLGAERIGLLTQVDTCYRMPDGRLKRRETPGEPVEWIFYHRRDVLGPRLSNYSILSEEQATRRWGVLGLRPWVTVQKMREVWMLGGARIHLDEVERLGAFVEFAVIIDHERTVAEGRDVIHQLRQSFAPVLGEQISVSYSDLCASGAC